MALTRFFCGKVLFLVFGLWAQSAIACGEHSDCEVSTGSYRIATPDSAPSERRGAIVFIHGWNSTPEASLRFAALRKVADRLGVYLIVPRGLNKSWGLPGVFDAKRDEVAFINASIDHAKANFPIDPKQILVSGFSLGGSMVWYLACAEGPHYAAYVAIAGAFWEPYVAECPSPSPTLVHIHGTADKVVPYEGRRIHYQVKGEDRSVKQGDVSKSFAILRATEQCPTMPKATAHSPEPACETQACGNAQQQLCLHNAGHSIRPEWIEAAWQNLMGDVSAAKH